MINAYDHRRPRLFKALALAATGALLTFSACSENLATPSDDAGIPDDASLDMGGPDGSQVPSGMVFVAEARDADEEWGQGLFLDAYFPVTPGPLAQSDSPVIDAVEGCMVAPYWHAGCSDCLGSYPPLQRICRGGKCVPFRSAGPVTVSGTVLGDFEFLPDANGVYYHDVSLGTDNLFDEGDVLSVSAAGDEHPGFAATVIAPAEIYSTVPPLSQYHLVRGADPPIVSRTAGFTFTWQPVIADTTVAISLYGGAMVVTCSVADTGGFDVTPTMIEASTASAVTVLVVVGLQRRNTSTVETSEGLVRVVAAVSTHGTLTLDP